MAPGTAGPAAQPEQTDLRDLDPAGPVSHLRRGAAAAGGTQRLHLRMAAQELPESDRRRGQRDRRTHRGGGGGGSNNAPNGRGGANGAEGYVEIWLYKD